MPLTAVGAAREPPDAELALRRPGLHVLRESEPEKFHLPRESDMRFNWVHAWTAALDELEMWELVMDAWRMVVPKKVSAARLGTP